MVKPRSFSVSSAATIAGRTAPAITASTASPSSSYPSARASSANRASNAAASISARLELGPGVAIRVGRVDAADEIARQPALFLQPIEGFERRGGDDAAKVENNGRVSHAGDSNLVTWLGRDAIARPAGIVDGEVEPVWRTHCIEQKDRRTAGGEDRVHRFFQWDGDGRNARIVRFDLDLVRPRARHGDRDIVPRRSARIGCHGALICAGDAVGEVGLARGCGLGRFGKARLPPEAGARATWRRRVCEAWSVLSCSGERAAPHDPSWNDDDPFAGSACPESISR